MSLCVSSTYFHDPNKVVNGMWCCGSSLQAIDDTALLANAPRADVATPADETDETIGSPLFAGRQGIPNPISDTRNRLAFTLESGTVEDLVLELRRMAALNHDMALKMADGIGKKLIDTTCEQEKIALLFEAETRTC